MSRWMRGDVTVGIRDQNAPPMQRCFMCSIARASYSVSMRAYINLHLSQAEINIQKYDTFEIVQLSHDCDAGLKAIRIW